MKKTPTLLFVLLSLLSSTAEAKLNKLQTILSRAVRPEVVIALDTSGSMNLQPTPTAYSGTYISGGDCTGDRSGTVDIRGDGMCTGHETPASAPEDCNLTTNNTTTPGEIKKCGNSDKGISRMAVAKRALRTVLPKLKGVASFGLATFNEHGYFQYFRGASAGTTKKVSAFFSKIEMEHIGAWDASAGAPRSEFIWNGTPYKLLSHPDIQADTANIKTDKDSLYADQDDSSSENRFKWDPGNGVGQVHSQGGTTWEYRGSYYVYEQSQLVSASTCNYSYSPSKKYSVCCSGSSTCKTVSTYMGPQYNDGTYDWVYRRWTHGGWYWSDQGIYWNKAGKIVLPLITASDQPAHNTQVARFMALMNAEQNGGIHAVGTTSTREMIAKVKTHYQDRANGTGPFAGNPDGAAGCRPRFMVLIADGHSDTGNPVPNTQALYDAYPLNRIKTYAIGMNLPQYAKDEMNAIAAAGGTGTALFAENESELVDKIEQALLEALAGDYTTSSPGACNVPGGAGSTTAAALLTSTSLPGWNGHLRAVDVTKTCTTDADCGGTAKCLGDTMKLCYLWDAGEELTARNWYDRKLYTGFSTTLSRDPVKLLVPSGGSGVICLTGGSHGTCDAKGVADVWQEATGTAAPSDLAEAMQWLAGKGRSWKLGAVVNSTPATVGPPSKKPDLPGHAALESAAEDRQTLVYTVSNDGLLHAFDAASGEEMFAYLPGHLLEEVYELYKSGGQPSDPHEFKTLLANSPRVEDLAPKPDAASPTGGWRTYLVQTDGEGDEEFVVLDITDPTYCASGDDPCTTYAVNAKPFTIEFSSQKASPGIAGTLGKTFSVPALYWDPASSGQMSMASGYGAGDEGEYYNHFAATDALPWTDTSGISSKAVTSVHHMDDGGSPEVTYAVIANTVAVQDRSFASLPILATYQADLFGRIRRFDLGRPNSTALVLDEGAGHPFHYSPAAFYMSINDGTVALAAASGAFDEDEIEITSTQAKFASGTTFVSKIFLLTEKAGAPDVAAACSVNNICACLSATGCTNPSGRAVPVGSPLLVQNEAQSNRMEAFYLYYEPPTSFCDLNAIADGTSWLIRVAHDKTTNTASLVEMKDTPGQASGLTLMGGETKQVVLVKSGKGGSSKASVETASGNVVGTGGSGLAGAPPRVEAWREVR